MTISRSARAAGHGLRLALFLLFSAYTIHQLVELVQSRGWGPGALFWLLVVTGAVSLVWRATADFRKALRRLRA